MGSIGGLWTGFLRTGRCQDQLLAFMLEVAAASVMVASDAARRENSLSFSTTSIPGYRLRAAVLSSRNRAVANRLRLHVQAP